MSRLNDLTWGLEKENKKNKAYICTLASGNVDSDLRYTPDVITIWLEDTRKRSKIEDADSV